MQHTPPHRSPFFRAYGFWHWGEGFQTVLFTWYMTFHANLTASEIGFFQALVLSPFLIFAIAGGTLTDRFGAGASYGVSTTLFGVILIAYGVLDHQFGYLTALFVAYCIFAGIVSAVSNPAIDTFIPDASDQPVQANSLLAATAHNIAKLTGNISALVLPIVGAGAGFLINGVLMLISVGFLNQHRQGTPRPVRPAGLQPALLPRVIHHYRDCPENLDILLSSALLGLIIVPAGYILIPLTLREKFPENGDLIALLGISSWVGAITLTAVAKRLSPRIMRPGRLALLIWAAYGVGLLWLTQVGSFRALCLTVMIFGGVKVAKALVYGKYLHNSPAPARGVLVAVDQTAFWGLATLGTFGMGLAVDGVGLNLTIGLSSGCILLGVVGLGLRGNLVGMAPA